MTLALRSGWIALAACLGCVAPERTDLGSRANPVRAFTYLGEFEYLTRLRCPDGTRPHFQRLPNRRAGRDGRMLNGYRVRCIYLNAESEVFIDTFHPDYVELEPVPGFSLGRPPDRRRLFWREP
jgi:hypothetical protein